MKYGDFMKHFLLKVYVSGAAGVLAPNYSIASLTEAISKSLLWYEIYCEGQVVASFLPKDMEGLYFYPFGLIMSHEVPKDDVLASIKQGDIEQLIDLSNIGDNRIIFNNGVFVLLECLTDYTLLLSRIDEMPFIFDAEMESDLRRILFDYLAEKFVFPNPDYAFRYELDFIVEMPYVFIKIRPIARRIVPFEALLERKKEA